MIIDPTSWGMAATGGALIGLGASTLLLFNGRIAGISGIFSGLLHPTPGDTLWKGMFLTGLLLGGVAVGTFYPAAFGTGVGGSIGMLAASGFLVGFGTRMGNGCTSGHGVCGLTRFSPRSLVAVVTFMATGTLTVTLVRLLGGM